MTKTKWTNIFGVYGCLFEFGRLAVVLIATAANATQQKSESPTQTFCYFSSVSIELSKGPFIQQFYHVSIESRGFIQRNKYPSWQI
jgi:hypothetical protein